MAESFNWTVQTDNPTLVTKGEDESLIWNFTLTADEQTKNDRYNFVKWHKFNKSSLDYDSVGGRIFSKGFGGTAYMEPLAPHIMVDRNRQATLLINNVRREDGGTYKIEYGDGTLLAYQEFNVTVLGKVSCVTGFCSLALVVKWVSWAHSVFKFRKNDPVLKLRIKKCVEYLLNYCVLIIVKPGHRFYCGRSQKLFIIYHSTEFEFGIELN